MDPVLDTSIEDQAIARVHRIGQSRPVEAIRLVATDTVDETILELQALRRGQKKGVQGTGDLRVAELVKRVRGARIRDASSRNIPVADSPRRRRDPAVSAKYPRRRRRVRDTSPRSIISLYRRLFAIEEDA